MTVVAHVSDGNVSGDHVDPCRRVCVRCRWTAKFPLVDVRASSRPIVLASSEAALIALGAASSYGWPKLILLAGIVALGQCGTHALVFQSGRGLAAVGARGRPKLEARLVRARAGRTASGC